MVVLENLEQGSKEWLIARAGRITASRAADFSAPPSLAPFPSVEIYKEGKVNKCTYNGCEYQHTSKAELQKIVRFNLPRVFAESRNGYMHELIGQVCTGEIKEQVRFKQSEWGHENEDIARAAFSFKSGLDVSEVGFIYKDDQERAGISPDGIVGDFEAGLEIKCPFDTRYHIDFLVSEKIKPEYIEQCQFSMWVTGFKRWYFASFDPRIKAADKKLHYVAIERDDLFMKKYDDAYNEFINEMDNKLESIGFKFEDIYG